ncbi:hypothetical protein NDU88_009823 [Pleurodeles waltl]|uniref:Uncharacterized protein n=1 Tax=Pleurodeles waltl TaxID=8319 RepID=A0AAV7S1H4_PLEWA|nr:hypothetical protein NDU88_009823 [Pleurodeles waltl]
MRATQERDPDAVWMAGPQVKMLEKTKGRLRNNPGEWHQGVAGPGHGGALERHEVSRGGLRGGTVQQKPHRSPE